MFKIIAVIILFSYIIAKKFYNKITIISVDGNIGSGKSTLVKYLKSKFKKYHFIDEPVDQWVLIVDNKNENILNKFYDNQSRYSYLFQNFAFITRANILMNKIKYLKKKLFCKKIIITERSVETDRNIFAKMLHDSNKLTDLEYKIYNFWYNNLFPEIKIKNIIYLRTDPEIALARIKKRNRQEEENITLSYIKDVHNYHEKWLKNNTYNICTLDGNIENYKAHADKIENFINIVN